MNLRIGINSSRFPCVAAIENLFDKYAVTAEEIETKRDEAADKLKGFLVELGYG